MLKDKLNKWFSQNYEHVRYEVKRNIAHSQMTPYADELLSVCTEAFLNKTEAQQQQMLDDNKIENFILFCCGMQIKSGTSPFYREVRGHRMLVRSGMEKYDNHPLEEEDPTKTELWACMERELDDLGFYYKTLITEKWMNHQSYKAIRKKYGITLNSIQRDIAYTYNHIREKCACI